MRELTVERTKVIYREAIGPRASDAEGEDWWNAVTAAVKQVIAANSPADAAKAFAWWHNDWSLVGDTAKAAANRVRKAAHKAGH